MRYLPLTDADRRAMLGTIGVDHVDTLFADVPPGALLTQPIAGLPNHQSELAVERHMARLAARNVAAGSAPFFCGAGAYRHHVPASVDHLIQRGEFLTSYTPYQPEVAQGTLQVLFEFQTQVALLTGCDVANASMYDGATATAEAVAMAMRVTKRDRAVLAGSLHPHYREVVETQARLTGTRVEALPVGTPHTMAAERLGPEVACLVVQNPSVLGEVEDLRSLAQACRAAGALLIVAVTEIVSLGLLTPPGEMGADIVVAEGQSLGNPLGFGGPYVGLFATRAQHVRQMPGRLCGETVDADGRRGFVLTLSTREQHIRREKATSNICTNSGLCALAFSIHLSLLGETGLRRLAEINHARARQLADALRGAGATLLTRRFFNEFAVRLRSDATETVDALAARGVLAGVPLARLVGPAATDDDRRTLLLAATETVSDDDIAALVTALRPHL